MSLDRNAAIASHLKPSARYSDRASQLIEQIQILLEDLDGLETLEAIRVRSALAAQLSSANARALGGA